MAAVDFEAWAIPNLVITLGGHTYEVRPPSVDDARKLLAAAVRGEIRLGIKKGTVPDEVQAVLDTIQPGDHPALGDVYDQLVADGHNPAQIDRVAYYAVFYWARGKAYADALATILWAPRDVTAGTGEPAPKG